MRAPAHRLRLARHRALPSLVTYGYDWGWPINRERGTYMKLGLRQAIASAAVFGAVLLGVVSVDDRVRERFGDLISGGDGISTWGNRAAELGSALVSAARHQSIENAPLVVFATVGAVLVLFMLRT